MNLTTLKPAYHTLPLEQRLRWLARIQSNRSYPTGRMCNYLSWQNLPNILKGDNLEQSTQASNGEASPLDTPQSPALAHPGLLPPLSGPEPSPACGGDEL